MALARKGLIWSVGHKELDHSSWLIATMHVNDQRAYLPFEKAVSLMPKTSLYLAETDIDALLSSTLPTPDDHTTYPGLKATLGDRQFDRARRILSKAFGLDLMHFQDLKPFVVLNQVSMLCLNMDHPFPLDVALWQAAKGMSIPTQGLESIEEQAALFHHLDLKRQTRMFIDMRRNVSRFRKRTSRLINLFVDQDLHGLYKRTVKDLGEMRHPLVYNRNEIMARRLTVLMKKAPLMASVGAGHFSGYKGLLTLLSTQGFRLKPVVLQEVV